MTESRPTPNAASLSLIATDLDGTLLRSDGTVSARTRRAIQDACEAGFAIVLVTARPPRVIGSICEELGVASVAVCLNGTMLYDVGRDEVLHHSRLDTELARECIDTLRAISPDIVFAIEHGHKLGYEPRFPRIDDGAGHLARVDHAHRLCEEDITKLLVHHPTQPLEELTRLARQRLEGRAEVAHAGGGPFFEVFAPGISKATGLKLVCDELSVGSDAVIAFGDMPNDLPMLEFAGWGVAVANAHPGLLALADEVTASNDEDGVAQTIERLLAHARPGAMEGEAR